ncbi:chemotaxis-specific protein-glutamate methyltransferase CheB [Halococcoides cellulosivorans]|uniref:Protein-glutamate methylesterase/protein-glutamine glutaminase n=1 Tax=Halococcoides cellulosivorans TaxID=1679096 RepID=A0A2R4X041_9EURY|nr:chemotaxis-specific protein-glutamate methyltransferase CheB [Halococcoides cellulosivorans]AWB27170.1 chemotaxis response regulator protein-glutamate methylesterase [Halococcoides cellulosivorans]
MDHTASIRAVVADDSHFMRSVISDVLDEGGIDVVATAANGREAVRAVREHDPDVVTMDVEMPTMNGLDAVERIMDEHPTPIVMLSAHTSEGADVTFEALDRGAVDFVAKPGGEVSATISSLEDSIRETVRTVASADVSAGGVPQSTTTTTSRGATLDRPTLVIGSSTGGPSVVEHILESLPIEADFRILVVQHMPKDFTARFADRLDAHSAYSVREASHGDTIGGGDALVAPGDYHLVVDTYDRGRLSVALSEEPPVNSVRPSVDVTMTSAADVVTDPLVGVVVTGMGRDGAAGIEAIKAAGGRTIAQDAATSAVDGMPTRAAETGCVDTVAALEDLPRAIQDAIERETATNE